MRLTNTDDIEAVLALAKEYTDEKTAKSYLSSQVWSETAETTSLIRQVSIDGVTSYDDIVDVPIYIRARVTAIPELDISVVTTATTPFTNCFSLTSIKFTGTNTAWPADLTLANSALTATSVEEFFNSLPTITTSRAITLTNTPASPVLTEAQIAIATDKNWTVTK